MCDIVTALSVGQFAVGAASQMASYAGQVDAYNAQVQYQQAQAKQRVEESKAATANYNKASARLDVRDAQSAAAAGQSVFEMRLQSMREASTAKVAAAEAGVSGISVDALLADFYAREGRASRASALNLESEYNESFAQREALYADAQSVYRATLQPIRRPQKPSLIATGLGIAGEGLTAYTDYRSQQPENSTTT